jgi:hypothetical protein
MNQVLKLFLHAILPFVCMGYSVSAVEIIDRNITPQEDVPFRQATSVKFKISPKMQDAKLKKVVVDYRDNVYVLTDQGLCRDFPGGILARDYTYASLADKTPVDICIQEGTGYLYYLYPTRYLTNAHAGTLYGRIPENTYHAILVNSEYEILLLGDKQAALFHRNEKLVDIDLPKEPFIKIGAAGKKFYYLTEDTLYQLENRQWKAVHQGNNLTAFVAGKDKIYLGTQKGYYSLSFQGAVIDTLNDKLPVAAINGLADVHGALWFTSNEGAYVREPNRFRYFAWKRWLDNNKLKDIAYDSKGNVYLLSESGLNEIRYVEQTLAQKAAMIQEDLEKYHLRHGWSVASRLVDPADPTTTSLRDNDNDGLWTSIYLGSQVFRYAVTGEEIARCNVWESFEAFERNLTVHDIPGFSSRTFERKGYAISDLKAWRDSPEEDWVWKGTTSTDEVVGYIFAAALMDKYICKTPEEKKRVADYIDAILTHVLKHDYYMVDYDGKPTLWARWNPEYVNRFKDTQFDRKLNSTLLTAMLQLGYKLTGKEIYKTEMYRTWKEWGYAENMMIPMSNIKFTTGFVHQGIVMGGDWNHSDDEMAFLTYWALIYGALDNESRKKYKWMIKDHWEIERPERNALWNIIPYSLCGVIDLASTIEWLREFNLDRQDYKMHNSHRGDLELIPRDVHTNFRDQLTKEPLTQGEMRMMRHNANGFSLDGGHDHGEHLTGEEFLLPYWMCRYYGILK